jgi:hypothetical protein
MFYKLIKALPKHDIGELVYLSESSDLEYYEWVESPNYLLPKDIVEDSNEFFEYLIVNWVKGEKIFYVNSLGEIIENVFNPKAHIKLVLSNNCFKKREDAEWFLEKAKALLNEEILITDKESILNVIKILKSSNNKGIKSAINILNKIIE